MIIPDDFILVCVKFLVNKGSLKVSNAFTHEDFRFYFHPFLLKFKFHGRMLLFHRSEA
jgi:hypothetical protein